MAGFIRVEDAAAQLGRRFDDVALMAAGERCSLLAARACGSGRRVAVKLPNDPADRRAGESLRREGELLAAIGAHPHIVELLETLTLRDGRCVLVFDQWAGSLADLGGTAATARSAVSIGIKLCGALETVHLAGVLHTDVRPANVILSPAGEPALAGFDAAVPSDSGDRLPLHAATPHVAPELLQGEPVSEATDAYGLGLTLFELLAGHPAFPARTGETPAELGLRILRGATASLPPGIPRELAELLSWALSVEPAERTPGPAWLAEALSHIERSQNWARTSRIIGRVPSAVR
jgi:serine/threonine protein kinase